VEAAIRFRRRGQMAIFKDYLRAGRYRLRYEATNPHRTGFVHVVSRDNVEVGVFRLKGLQPIEVDLPAADKYLFRVFLAPRSELGGLALRRIGAAPPASAEGGG